MAQAAQTACHRVDRTVYLSELEAQQRFHRRRLRQAQLQLPLQVRARRGLPSALPLRRRDPALETPARAAIMGAVPEEYPSMAAKPAIGPAPPSRRRPAPGVARPRSHVVRLLLIGYLLLLLVVSFLEESLRLRAAELCRGQLASARPGLRGSQVPGRRRHAFARLVRAAARCQRPPSSSCTATPGTSPIAPKCCESSTTAWACRC